MDNKKFALLLEEIAEKVKSYPEGYTVDYLHIKMWKQRNKLWITIPLLYKGEQVINLNYKLEA